MFLLVLGLTVQSTGPWSIKSRRCSWLWDTLNFIHECRPGAGLESTWEWTGHWQLHLHSGTRSYVCGVYTILSSYPSISHLCVCVGVCYILFCLSTKIIQDTTNPQVQNIFYGRYKQTEQKSFIWHLFAFDAFSINSSRWNPRACMCSRPWQKQMCRNQQSLLQCSDSHGQWRWLCR